MYNQRGGRPAGGAGFRPRAAEGRETRLLISNLHYEVTKDDLTVSTLFTRIYGSTSAHFLGTDHLLESRNHRRWPDHSRKNLIPPPPSLLRCGRPERHVLHDKSRLSSTDNLGEKTNRCGDRAKMGWMQQARWKGQYMRKTRCLFGACSFSRCSVGAIVSQGYSLLLILVLSHGLTVFMLTSS
jgi:hypothetical protein